MEEVEATRALRLFDSRVNRLVFKSVFPKYKRLNGIFTLCEEQKWNVPTKGKSWTGNGKHHLSILTHFHLSYEIPKEFQRCVIEKSEDIWKWVVFKTIHTKSEPSCVAKKIWNLRGWDEYVSDHPKIVSCFDTEELRKTNNEKSTHYVVG